MNLSSITVVFGRFNPPTSGHERLIRSAQRIADGGQLRIYPSRKQDRDKNPLDPIQKIEYMRKIFPEHKDDIIDNENIKTIFDVLVAAYQQGYSEVNIVVGSDRQEEFERITAKYNGNLYAFNSLKVLSAGFRDPDIEGVNGISASKMRIAATNNDFSSFRRGMPSSASDQYTRSIFDAVREGMGLVDKPVTAQLEILSLEEQQ